MGPEALLSASVARAAAAAQVARARPAKHGAVGGAPRAAVGSGEESIVFDVPLHLADKAKGC